MTVRVQNQKVPHNGAIYNQNFCHAIDSNRLTLLKKSATASNSLYCWTLNVCTYQYVMERNSDKPFMQGDITLQSAYRVVL